MNNETNVIPIIASANTKGLETLLHWMEVNESAPYGAMPAALLAAGKNSTHDHQMYHYEHNEKSYVARKHLMNTLTKNFANSLTYGEDSVILFENDSPVAVLDINERATYADVNVIGIPEYVRQLMNFVNASGRTKKQPIISRIYKNSYGFDDIELTLPTVKPVSEIGSFYPFVDKTPKQLWDEFKVSDSNVLLFIGPPGTGKTSFIRQMIDYRGYDDKVHVVDNEALLLDPELMGYVQSEAEISLLITEDADRFVAKREDDNASMVGLLNASNGLAGGRVKFIISTNLQSVKSVDAALLRPGRCHKILPFRKLTAQEATIAREAAGLPFREFKYDATLAEALNESNSPDDLMSGMGFITK